ncbi:RNA polymerase sigma factor [Niabella drilacis]|uniref:RNA polymerase sigma-70 factor, ECF subfamily n=1 Tax=Niabella drilacis (strain DSM 25811 / CCM 8410 / CCUG 62505 / LMG 26954 / E90) TaxID=1285928 RepID=A0A1G6VIS5_NIADE|nr:sigma-70 family RNA polymerase sigma factor [Niabella drilacis]SDD52947.1 RNA polymerase sigma-70 factor, ECF subfamily [Niabella drilacis]
MNNGRYDHIDDQELLRRYLQEHDSSWLGILLERYTLLLFGVCMKYLKDETQAQDAVQQVFLKVIQEVHKYRIDYFKSWLYTVAKNHCLTMLRDKKRMVPVELTADNPVAARDEEVPEQEAISPELLKDALDALSVEQRQSVILFYLEKKSYQEISASEGYSLLQVKSYIQNGKRNLKLLIQKMLKKAKNENG